MQSLYDQEGPYCGAHISEVCGEDLEGFAIFSACKCDDTQISLLMALSFNINEITHRPRHFSRTHKNTCADDGQLVRKRDLMSPGVAPTMRGISNSRFLIC